MAWRGTTIALPGQLSCIPGRGGEGARTHTFRASPLRTIDWRRYRYQRPLGPGAVDTSRWTRVQGVADGGMAGGPRGKAEEARYVLVLSTDYWPRSTVSRLFLSRFRGIHAQDPSLANQSTHVWRSPFRPSPDKESCHGMDLTPRRGCQSPFCIVHTCTVPHASSWVRTCVPLSIIGQRACQIGRNVVALSLLETPFYGICPG